MKIKSKKMTVSDRENGLWTTFDYKFRKSMSLEGK